MKLLRQLLNLTLVFALAGTTVAKEVIKVGVVFPLAGNNAYMGEMGRAGIQMRLAELGGKGKFDYKVICEDDGFEFRRTNAAIQKLKNIDKVDVLMTMWGYGSEIAQPLIKDGSLVHINADRWTEGRAPYDYAAGNSLEANVSQCLAVVKALGARRVAIMGTADQGWEAYKKELIKQLPAQEVQVLDAMTLSTDVRDLRTWLLKTENKKADLIIECAAMPVVQILLQQMRERGLATPVLHITTAIFEVPAEMKEGQLFVTATFAKPDWQAHFEKEFGKAGNYPAPQFYNAMELLINAAERLDSSRKPAPAELAKSIESIKEFEGATGPLIFDGRDRYEAPVSIYIFRKGIPEPIAVGEISKQKGADL